MLTFAARYDMLMNNEKFKVENEQSIIADEVFGFFIFHFPFFN